MENCVIYCFTVCLSRFTRGVTFGADRYVACKNLRTGISGFVFLSFMGAIFLLRISLKWTSALGNGKNEFRVISLEYLAFRK